MLIRRRFLSIFIFFVFVSAQSFAQKSKYWIFFKDKTLTKDVSLSLQCQENRRNLGLRIIQNSDIPLEKTYLNYLQNIDIQVLVQSKWLNAVSAQLNNAQKKQVEKLDFVKEIIPIESQIIVATEQNVRSKNEDELRVDYALKQIGVEHFLYRNLNGAGVKIGVVDAGFYEANKKESLIHLFENKQILGVRDYVNPQKKDFFGIQESYSDFHGAEVLASIAGKNIQENYQLGLATQSEFYLARTDSGNREFRGEEDNWVAAIEWLDSLGVRLVNTSLGYAKGFSNPKESYTPEQMDGKTSVIARAAKIAVEEKGMILIVSAGNEGDDDQWRIISTPADVDGVIAVGATNEWGLKMGFSSIGPTFLPYIKPNIACFSLRGTSLSAPVITGFVACLLQLNPSLTNKEISHILEKSSNLYAFPNNFLGFGIPNAGKAVALLLGNEVKNEVKKIEVGTNEKTIQISVSAQEKIILFHKSSPTIVLMQEVRETNNGIINLTRNDAIKQTSIITPTTLIEVIWK